MEPWAQVYDPLQNAWLSTAMAALPIVLLLGLLVAGLRAQYAALVGLLSAQWVAIAVYKMPVATSLAAGLYGVAFGLFPIGWIVLAAVFLFNLTVATGQFDVVKRSVAAISPDRRVQALLIAFSFGAFVEGAAGFGTPVAISAALMIGLGFTPLYAAGLALIANTSPVAFGALGTPILTLAKMVDNEPNAMTLSAMAGRQLPFFSLIVPAWLVWTMSGWRGLRGCWPAVLVCGGSFAILQFLAANYHGPTLVDVAGGLGSLVCLTIFSRYWQPREVWRFPDEYLNTSSPSADTLPATQPATDEPLTNEIKKPGGEAEIVGDMALAPAATNPLPLTTWGVTYAWMPWVLLSVLVFLWGWPSFKDALNADTSVKYPVRSLHQQVYRTGSVAKKMADPAARDLQEAFFEFNWLSATGTGIFLAAILSALWLQVSPRIFIHEFVDTTYRMRWALFTIACMLALAFTTKYCGSDATLGLAFTRTGWMYPFFAPLLGWLGVALTGSDTSSNALFGSLQKITAQQLDLNTTLIVASNSTGGVMGKMIDAQSIVVAAVATRSPGQEGPILRFVFPHSLALAALVGLLTFLQARYWTWMIP